MIFVLGIDPGSIESGWCVIEEPTLRPVQFGKTPNAELREMLISMNTANLRIAMEIVVSFGMPVGQEVFETCEWIGRYTEVLQMQHELTPRRVTRQDVKIHHCHDSRAKDSNVIQALVNRFTPGARNYGKGTKAEPGWFYGFFKDLWSAYAIAVFEADQFLMPGLHANQEALLNLCPTQSTDPARGG